MASIKSIARTTAIVVSAAVTVGALVADIAGFIPGVDWQWLVFVGFVAFAGLVGWRIHELRSELTEITSNQDLELALRGVSERGQKLKLTQTTVPSADLITRVDEVREWIAEAEVILAKPNYVSHFRGGFEGPFEELDGVLEIYTDAPDDPVAAIRSVASIGTQLLNGFIDSRLQRIGEILFSLPGPNGKVARLG